MNAKFAIVLVRREDFELKCKRPVHTNSKRILHYIVLVISKIWFSFIDFRSSLTILKVLYLHKIVDFSWAEVLRDFYMPRYDT